MLQGGPAQPVVRRAAARRAGAVARRAGRGRRRRRRGAGGRQGAGARAARAAAAARDPGLTAGAAPAGLHHGGAARLSAPAVYSAVHMAPPPRPRRPPRPAPRAAQPRGPEDCIFGNRIAEDGFCR